MKKTVLVLFIVLAVIVSCDRFSRDFAPVMTRAEFVENFNSKATNYLQEGNTNGLMSFFDNGYKNGLTDVLEIFSRDWSNQAIITVEELSQTRQIATFTAYEITISDEESEIADVSWIDYLSEVSPGVFLWVGNGKTVQEVEFIEGFNVNAKTYLLESKIEDLMNLYSNNYMNDGSDRNDMELLFNPETPIEWTTNVVLQATDYGRTAYRIVLKDEVAGVDTTWVDYVGVSGEEYLWVGNQDEGDPEKFSRVVFAQGFTGLDCQSCPLSSNRLKEIAKKYPENFVYIKYHSGNTSFGDSLILYNRFRDEVVYYGAFSNPAATFQGEALISGTNNLNSYQTSVERLLKETPELRLNDLQFAVNNRTITGSVSINFTQLDTEHLYLHYAVIEKIVEGAKNSYANPPTDADNVVRGRGRHLMVNLTSGSTVNFDLLSQKPLVYPSGASRDMYVVVWVQRMINDDGVRHMEDKILDVIKKDIPVSKADYRYKTTKTK